MTLRIAALASGSGSNVLAIADSIAKGSLDASLVLLLSNKPDAPVLKKARDRNITVWSRDHRDYLSREAFDRDMIEAIQEIGADTIVLAGYMRLLSPCFVQAFSGRILNVHPAVLPSFPGAHAPADALNYGVRFTGVTVHFVDEFVDNGPVIIQGLVPVSASDTLESLMPRIHALEHRIYPQALQWLAKGRLSLEGRRVLLLPGERPFVAPASCGDDLPGFWMVAPALEDF